MLLSVIGKHQWLMKLPFHAKGSSQREWIDFLKISDYPDVEALLTPKVHRKTFLKIPVWRMVGFRKLISPIVPLSRMYIHQRTNGGKIV